MNTQMIGIQPGTIQRTATLNVEAFESGYVVSTSESHADGSYTSRRDIVTNLDALTNFVRGWSARYHASPLPSET